MEWVDDIDVTEGDWYLQNSKGKENDWRLSSYKDCPNSKHYYPIGCRSDIITVIGHLYEKSWVDLGKVLLALLPAIHFFYEHQYIKGNRKW